MTISLKAPSVEGADVVGLFDEYDRQKGLPDSGESWARSVVAKMWKDNSDQGGSHAVNRLHAENYSQEQWEAWEWFRNETKPTQWRNNVEDYQKDQLDPPPSFNPDESYIDKPPIGFTEVPVKPFDSRSGGKDGVAVNTAAVKHFANTLTAIAPAGAGILMEAKTVLDKVDPRPGSFALAVLTRELFVTPTGGGLKEETKTVLDRVQQTLYEVVEELNKITKDYDDAEALNGLSVEKFSEMTGRSDSKVNALGDIGTKNEAVTDG
jgi:hypothetical protein